MTTKDLVSEARNYAKHDDYSVTRNYINALCDEIDRLRSLNKNVLAHITDNGEMFKNAERYLWLKSASWDLPEDAVAPTVLLCDGRGNNWEWITGVMLDEEIDKWMEKNK